jgi:DNA-directed RNA polymerase specialized sigma24 family protein
MSTDKSITRWIQDLKAGGEEAARLLWHEYFDKLVAVARKQLGDAPRRVADEEDVALSVFRCLCDGAARGQFSGLANRDDLWRLLIVITTHKVIDQRRAATGEKRGGGQVRGDSVFKELDEAANLEGFDQLLGKDPSPDFLAMLADEHRRLMGLLPDDTLRKVALRKMEGYKNEEIAQELGLARRSIQRKLERIRQAWLADVAS